MVIILQGSAGDREWSDKIVAKLSKYGIGSRIYTASAHKTPEYLLSLLKKFETKNPLIYVCVAGRSNALGGFVDANTVHPVINCPPQSGQFAGLDLLSSLRMPSGVGAVTVLEPDAAAVACAKILGVSQKGLKDKIASFQEKNRIALIKTNILDD